MNSFIFNRLSSKARLGAGIILLLACAGWSSKALAQYNFTTNNGTITITQYTGSGGSVTIPDTINGRAVTAIAANAFNQVSSLTSLTMGTNLTTIGTNAIFQCYNLTSVAFTGSVTNIGLGPFYDCLKLTVISMTSTNAYFTVTNGALCNKAATSLIQYPGGLGGTYTISFVITNIGEAFNGNSLTAINVVSSNSYFTNLDGVLFSKNQTQLIEYPGALSGSYTVPSSATTIQSASFEFSTGLTSISIGANVTSIGYVAFYDSSSLSSFSVNSANAYYSSTNGALFNKNQTILIQYPIAVGGTYTIPGTVTNIADGAFGDDFTLTSVIIPNSVTYIGVESFYACESLASVSLGNGLTNIGVEAFFYCPVLPSITIPASVKTISAYAFGECLDLTNACFQGNEPTDGGNIFYYDNSLATILYVSGSTGWGASYDGIATAPCVSCSGPAPQLSIVVQGTNAVITWPSSFTGYTLQSITNIVLTNWATVSPAPVVVSSQYVVTNQTAGTKKFYRLIK